MKRQHQLHPISNSSGNQSARPKPGDAGNRSNNRADACLQRAAQQRKLHPPGHSSRKREPGDAPARSIPSSLGSGRANKYPSTTVNATRMIAKFSGVRVSRSA